MSYHITPRVLERLAGRAPKSLFADCIHHILHGSQPAFRQFQAVQALSSRSPSAGVLERHIRELWAIDLNPLARVANQVKSLSSVVRAWNAYNSSGNVTTPITLEGQEKNDQSLSKRILRSQMFPLIDLNMTAAGVLVDVISDTVLRNLRKTDRHHFSSDFTVSALVRILGQERKIIYEASLFFEAQPGANVADLSQALGVHQRTVERQFRREGLTAIELKRACALVGATQDLWSGTSLSEIAYARGYADH